MMRMEKAGEQRRQFRETEAEWDWRKNYRVWDANRKIFLYPENWIEPELRLSTRFRAALDDVVAFICAKCGAKTKRKPIDKPARRKGARVLSPPETGWVRSSQPIKTDSQKNPRTVSSSSYARLGSTLTISGERNVPKWL